MLVLALIWSVAVLIKVGSALSRGQPYAFTWWDGGLVLNGKSMARAGSVAFGVFAAVLACVSAWVVMGMPGMPR